MHKPSVELNPFRVALALCQRGDVNLRGVRNIFAKRENDLYTLTHILHVSKLMMHVTCNVYKVNENLFLHL